MRKLSSIKGFVFVAVFCILAIGFMAVEIHASSSQDRWLGIRIRLHGNIPSDIEFALYRNGVRMTEAEIDCTHGMEQGLREARQRGEWRNDPALRVSDIPTISVRVSYGGAPSLMIPLSDFYNDDGMLSIRLHVQPGVAPSILTYTVIPTWDGDIEVLFDTLSASIDVVQLTYLYGEAGWGWLSDGQTSGYVDFPVYEIQLALYYNNERVELLASGKWHQLMNQGIWVINRFHHDLILRVIYEDGFRFAHIDNLEIRVVDWAGRTSERTVLPLRDMNISGGHNVGLNYVWHVFEGDAPTPTQVVTPPTNIQPPSTPTTAAHTLRFAIGSTTFTDNGVSRTLEAAPFIANDRTMVPLRVIGEALGATDLAFDAGVITFNINGQAFTMTVGQALPGNMGTPEIRAGRTFVPLAFIVNEMGATARWDSGARAAYIYIE